MCALCIPEKHLPSAGCSLGSHCASPACGLPTNPPIQLPQSQKPCHSILRADLFPFTRLLHYVMFGFRLDIGRMQYLQSSSHDVCIPTLTDTEEKKTRKDLTFSLYSTVGVRPISSVSIQPNLSGFH